MIITSLKNKFHLKRFLNKFVFSITKLTIVNIVLFCLMVPFYYTFSDDFIYNNNLLLNIPILILMFEVIYCAFIYKKSRQISALYGVIISLIFITCKISQTEIIINNVNITKYIYEYFYILFFPTLFLVFSIIFGKIIINNQLREKINFFRNIRSFPAIEIILLLIVILLKIINYNYLFIYFFDEYLCILIYLLLISVYNSVFLVIE